jgi:hypothetical protein
MASGIASELAAAGFADPVEVGRAAAGLSIAATNSLSGEALPSRFLRPISTMMNGNVSP